MKRFTFFVFACSACWGAGPMPTVPSGVEILFSVPPAYPLGDECVNASSPYIGDVSIAGNFAYATEMRFTPPDSCGGGGQMNLEQIPVHRIALATREVESSMAGTSQGPITTRVLATELRGAWVHSPNMATTVQFRGGGQVPPRELSYGGIGGFYLPVGFAGDDINAFVVATTGASNNVSDVNNPRYPCCNNTGGPTGSMPASLGWKVAWDNTPAEAFALPPDGYVISDTLKTGMVANSTTLFFAMRDRLDPTRLDVDMHSMSRTDTTNTQHLGGITTDVGIPVGLAANDEVVMWAVSASYARLPLPEPSCRLLLHDLASATESVLFATRDFSCQDLAIDDTHAYFTIISVEQDDFSDNSLAGMRGIGIGRVSLSSAATFESIATGTEGEYSGARRIYLHGDHMYVVDPFAIARISKSALDGQADF